MVLNLSIYTYLNVPREVVWPRAFQMLCLLYGMQLSFCLFCTTGLHTWSHRIAKQARGGAAPAGDAVLCRMVLPIQCQVVILAVTTLLLRPGLTGSARTARLENNIQNWALAFILGSRDRTQLIRFAQWAFCPPSHFPSPNLSFLVLSEWLLNCIKCLVDIYYCDYLFCPQIY